MYSYKSDVKYLDNLLISRIVRIFAETKLNHLTKRQPTMMNKIKKYFVCLCLTVPFLWSCSNRKSYTTPVFNTKRTITERPDTSTTTASEQKEMPKVEERKTVPVSSSSSSSSRSNRSIEYDNMRGFDPASENNMDDNGMSRYMDNYDDEGWN